MKEAFLTALLGLVIAVPVGFMTYSLFRLLLRHFGRGAQVACVLALALLGAGILYGLLRFSGMILFPDDNSMSVNWLNNSWRDDGFRYMYGCGTFAVGIVAALHNSKVRPMTKE